MSDEKPGENEQKLPQKPARGLLSGWKSRRKYKTLFTPDNHCLSVDIKTSQVWLFYTPELKILFDHAEYDHAEQRFFLVTEDQQRFDIGLEIQPDLREALGKADTVSVIRTKNRQPIGFFPLPIVQKNVGVLQATDNKDENGA